MRIAATKSAAAAGLAAAALFLAACSSTNNGSPTSPSSAPQTEASAPIVPSSSPASSPAGFPTTSASSTGGLTEAQATAALITAADVGSGFQQAPPGADSNAPLPCTPNDPPLSQQFPQDAKAEADFGGLNGKALINEEISTYKDTTTVGQVIAAGEQGLSCGTATVSGAQITIGGPTDLTAQLQTQVDKAEGWTLTSSGVNGELIIAQLGQHLVVFSFSADPSVAAGDLPNAEHIVNAGVAKVAAAIK